MITKHLLLVTCLGIIASDSFGQNSSQPSPPQAADLNNSVPVRNYPSEPLSEFISKSLDTLLAPLDRGIAPGMANYPIHGPGHVNTIKTPLPIRTCVTQLDQGYRSEYFSAPKEMQPVYAKAVAVTSELEAILVERDKRVSLFNNSRTVQPLSPLDSQKNKHQRHQARQKAHAIANNFSTADEQHWLEDCARYRQQVFALLDQVRIAERTVSSTISLSAPLQVPLMSEGRQVGSITIPAGQSLQIEGISADGVTFHQADQQHVVPLSAFSPADLEKIKALQTSR